MLVRAESIQIEPVASYADPFSVLCTLAAERLPFFLDSGMGHERLGRFSFLGCDPVLTLRSRGNSVWLNDRDAGTNPFAVLRRVLRSYAPDFPISRSHVSTPMDEMDAVDNAPSTFSHAPMRPCARAPMSPRATLHPSSFIPHPSFLPFTCGAVGYLAYDLARFVERLPDHTIDDIPIPEMHFALYDAVAAFDHQARTWYVSTADLGAAGLASRRRRLLSAIQGAGPPPRFNPVAARNLRSNFTRDNYLRAVRRTIDYIAAGDIFQVNLSQRFDAETDASPLELYAALRSANPAPFAAYLPLDDGSAVLSSSPERFLKLTGRHVETRPIKGTRPRRPADPTFNERMRRELLASAKDRAELTMIVDLERNDLGRVCAYGSVRVTEPIVLEQYPTVFHLVATVEGDLHDRHDLIDLIKAAFPGGSITGAPKIRAMEIIDELEPTKRSVYTGNIGYIGLDGRADLNIAIRTIILARGRAHLQVGGGIVADSEPAAEYQETLDKAKAMFNALGIDHT